MARSHSSNTKKVQVQPARTFGSLVPLQVTMVGGFGELNLRYANKLAEFGIDVRRIFNVGVDVTAVEGEAILVLKEVATHNMATRLKSFGIPVVSVSTSITKTIELLELNKLLPRPLVARKGAKRWPDSLLVEALEERLRRPSRVLVDVALSLGVQEKEIKSFKQAFYSRRPRLLGFLEAARALDAEAAVLLAERSEVQKSDASTLEVVEDEASAEVVAREEIAVFQQLLDEAEASRLELAAKFDQLTEEMGTLRVVFQREEEVRNDEISALLATTQRLKEQVASRVMENATLRTAAEAREEKFTAAKSRWAGEAMKVDKRRSESLADQKAEEKVWLRSGFDLARRLATAENAKDIELLIEVLE